MAHQGPHLWLIEIGWRASAEVQLFDFAAAIVKRSLHVDLLIEMPHVLFHPVCVSRHDFVAGTVVAKRLAEWNVNIKRKWSPGAVAGSGMFTVVVGGEAVMELQGGWI